MAKILVVDDDRTICRVIADVLECDGHEVFKSPNGKHAWDTLLYNEDIKLLITDIVMPEMDGCVLVQMIRGNTGLAGLPIIIMSSVVSIADIADLLEFGPNTFMSKPLNINEMKEIVTRYLEMDYGEIDG